MLQPDGVVGVVELPAKNISPEDLARLNALRATIAQKEEELQDLLESLRQPYGIPPALPFGINNWTGRITIGLPPPAKE